MKLKANYKIDFKSIKRGRGTQHLYGTNNEWFGSVTKITGLLDDGKSNALIYWAKNLVLDMIKDSLKLVFGKKLLINEGFITKFIREHERANDEALKQAGDWGNQTHAAIDEYIYGRDPYIMLETQEAKDGFDNFLSWLKQSELILISGDISVLSKKMGYGGKLDALALDKEGNLILLDWKTSNSIKFDYWFQVAGYWFALLETYSVRAKKAYIVRFSKGHNLKTKKGISIKDFEQVEVDLPVAKKGFLGLLRTSIALKKLKK